MVRKDEQQRPSIDERIRFFTHKGKKILFVDFSNCKAGDVEKTSRKVPDSVTTQPLGSVLILTDFAGASFDRDTLLTMKETAVFDKPFVKKSALIGTDSLPREFYEDMKNFSRRMSDGRSVRLRSRILPFSLTPFLRYITSVLLEYCLDGHLATHRPFP